jgi:hypothetical protein
MQLLISYLTIMENQNRRFTVLLFVLFLGLQNGTICFAQSNAEELPEIKVLQNRIDSLKEVVQRVKDKLVLKNASPNVVYVRCAQPTIFETEISKKEYSVFNGKNYNQEGVEKIKILKQEAHNEWRAAEDSELDPRFRGVSNDNCHKWHYKKIPAEYYDVYVVTDTVSIKDFDTQTFIKHVVVKESSLTEIREAVSHVNQGMSRKLISRIQNVLRNKGYKLRRAKQGEMDRKTRKALEDFQKKSGLKVGGINYQTLKALEIQR